MTKLFMNVFKKVKLKPEEYKLYDAKAHLTVLYIIPNMIWVKNQISVTQHKLAYYILQLFNKKCKKFSSGRKSWIQEYTDITENRNGLTMVTTTLMDQDQGLDLTLKAYKKCCWLHLVLSVGNISKHVKHTFCETIHHFLRYPQNLNFKLKLLQFQKIATQHTPVFLVENCQ